ncbi:ClC family H(+)/Cl(-) exchange transporter [Lacticaseibacillus pantheris]
MVTMRRLVDGSRLHFIGWGLVVGVLSGTVVATFRLCIATMLKWIQSVYMHPNLLSVGVVVGVGVLTTVIAAILLHQEPNISGSGIPQVEGQLQGTMEFHWWRILWRKFVAGVLAIGSGLFLGREGPSIQLGAAVGQGVAAGRHESGSERRVLIAAGAAGGLAAAFNAPIAGVMFVLEEVYHNFSPLVWMSSLASAVAADYVSMRVFGLTPVLHIAYAHSLPANLYWHLVLLGIILGLLGLLYNVVLLALPRWYAHILLPRVAHGIVPLLLIIPLGFWMPRVLGGGNAVILNLGGQMPVLSALCLLFVVRFVYSMIAYGSGLPGGIFLPILTLGAVIGAIYGVAMARMGLLPRQYVINLVIFAMAGYFAGISKAPFTAILLITEMVGNLGHLLPLAVVALVAYVTTDIFGGEPIYAALLSRMTVPDNLSRLHHPVTFEVPVFAGSTLDMHQVRDFTWPSGSLLVEIRRGEHRIVPQGSAMIRAGDTLVVMTDTSRQVHVREVVGGAAAQPLAD